MEYNSYIVQDTNLSLTMPLACPPPRKASHSKGLKVSRKAKKFGFTLAEVLITLTIIGVVAAMTIPTLLMKHQKQVYVTRLKKVYSTLTNAMQMLPLEMGCPAGDLVCARFFPENYNVMHTIDGQTFNSYEAQAYLLSKVIKTSCINNNCIPTNYPSNGHVYFQAEGPGKFVTEDGMFMVVDDEIGVDINGAQGPNKVGRDIFKFSVSKNANNMGTIIPFGSNGNWKSNCTTENINAQNNKALSCTGRVLEEDKMDY